MSSPNNNNNGYQQLQPHKDTSSNNGGNNRGNNNSINSRTNDLFNIRKLQIPGLSSPSSSSATSSVLEVVEQALQILNESDAVLSSTLGRTTRTIRHDETSQAYCSRFHGNNNRDVDVDDDSFPPLQ
jgi:hypothetical protein